MSDHLNRVQSDRHRFLQFPHRRQDVIEFPLVAGDVHKSAQQFPSGIRQGDIAVCVHMDISIFTEICHCNTNTRLENWRAFTISIERTAPFVWYSIKMVSR